MLRDGPVDLQRHVLVLLGSVLTHLDWTCAQIRGPQGLTLVQTLLDLQDSHPALRPETIRCVEVVLQRTCGSHACVPWLNAAGDDEIAGSRSASPVASRQPSLPPAPGSLPPPGPPSAAPRPISPTPAPAFSPVRPARTNAPDLGAAGAPPGSPSPARQSEQEIQEFTWSGEWARRRRQLYWQHSRRLSLISSRGPPGETPAPPKPPSESPRPTLHRAPSMLYPALYRQHSSGMTSTPVRKDVRQRRRVIPLQGPP